MELFAGFWDHAGKYVKVRYYGSTFREHSRHTVILNHFVGMTKDPKSECLYQISMYGPTVNMKVFQEFSVKFKNENYSLVDISSYSPHIEHGVFRTLL